MDRIHHDRERRSRLSGGTIQLFVNDLLIATVVDNDSPYTGGRIGLYTEDAEAYFDNVVVTSGGKGKKRR